MSAESAAEPTKHPVSESGALKALSQTDRDAIGYALRRRRWVAQAITTLTGELERAPTEEALMRRYGIDEATLRGCDWDRPPERVRRRDRILVTSANIHWLRLAYDLDYQPAMRPGDELFVADRARLARCLRNCRSGLRAGLCDEYLDHYA